MLAEHVSLDHVMYANERNHTVVLHDNIHILLLGVAGWSK